VLGAQIENFKSVFPAHQELITMLSILPR